MTYHPDQLADRARVERVRACGRTASRSLGTLGGAMIEERTRARAPIAPRRPDLVAAPAPVVNLARIEARLSFVGWAVLGAGALIALAIVGVEVF